MNEFTIEQIQKLIDDLRIKENKALTIDEDIIHNISMDADLFTTNKEDKTFRKGVEWGLRFAYRSCFVELQRLRGELDKISKKYEMGGLYTPALSNGVPFSFGTPRVTILPCNIPN